MKNLGNPGDGGSGVSLQECPEGKVQKSEIRGQKSGGGYPNLGGGVSLDERVLAAKLLVGQNVICKLFSDSREPTLARVTGYQLVARGNGADEEVDVRLEIERDGDGYRTLVRPDLAEVIDAVQLNAFRAACEAMRKFKFRVPEGLHTILTRRRLRAFREVSLFMDKGVAA